MHNLRERYLLLRPTVVHQTGIILYPYHEADRLTPSNPDGHPCEWLLRFATGVEIGQDQYQGQNHLPVDLEIEMHPKPAFPFYQILNTQLFSPTQNHSPGICD